MAENADIAVTSPKFVQKHLRNLAEFTLQEDKLVYHLRTGNLDTTREISYPSVQVHTQEHRTSSNTYFRNIGALFLAYGAVLGVYYPPNLIFAAFGVGALIYFFATKYGYSVYPSDNGNIIIFDGNNKDEILQEINKRRLAMLRKLLSPVNYKNTKERELAKYEFLKKEKAISDTEYELYISQVQEDGLKFLG